MARTETYVDVQVACDDPDIPESAEITRWVTAAVAAAGSNDAAVEVSVRIVDRGESQALNATFRQQDKPTNVLSFPADTRGTPDGEPRLLGDVVVSAPVVGAEAREQGKPAASHWAHMLVHGTLHLLGFDHEQQSEARRMEALEVRILAAQGIADPYASP